MTDTIIYTNSIPGYKTKAAIVAAHKQLDQAQALINEGDNRGHAIEKSIPPAIKALVGQDWAFVSKKKETAQAAQAKKDQQADDKAAQEAANNLLELASQGDEKARDQYIEAGLNEAGITLDVTYRYTIKKHLDEKTDEAFESKRKAIMQKRIDEINAYQAK